MLSRSVYRHGRWLFVITMLPTLKQIRSKWTQFEDQLMQIQVFNLRPLMYLLDLDFNWFMLGGHYSWLDCKTVVYSFFESENSRGTKRGLSRASFTRPKPTVRFTYNKFVLSSVSLSHLVACFRLSFPRPPEFVRPTTQKIRAVLRSTVGRKTAKQ